MNLTRKAEMPIEEFQRLPAESVAGLVRREGPRVCVFPINGTRRWFALEHPQEAATGSIEAYFRIAGQRFIELYRLFFDHGVDTLLTPIFGPELLERGEDYQRMMVPALLWFAQNKRFLDFYDSYDVRVRVYGDTTRYLASTPYAPALDAYAALAQRTADHQRHRLFIGVCAHDATESVAEFAVRFHQQQGRLPDKREIVKAYYGEYVEPADIFIGFDRPTVFDMPLVATGNENLYFTVSPSPYLSARTLRMILYDHLYGRQVDESSYAALSSEIWDQMGAFYHANLDGILGVGRKLGGIWYPLPQVKQPPDSPG
jgi:tuberculosinol/isotuberculosinol synthase